MTDLLAEKLALLPELPGVYLMKDASGKIIYVGKARILKNRVRQYFGQNKNHSAKVKAMVAHIVDFETIVTDSEIEALILESNLIKEHRPHYNISLKDDKSYPYLKITFAEDFPRLLVTRRKLNDGAKYFGPYADAGAMHDSVKLLRRLFPLRTCNKMGKRPCLYYHIKRCLAPCVGFVGCEEYRVMAEAVALFLAGRTGDIEKKLREGMERAAEELAFEKAAIFRDRLAAVQKVAEKQKITADGGDRDSIAAVANCFGAAAVVLIVRNGKMIGCERFMLTGGEGESKEELTAAFVKEYYAKAAFIPKEILLADSLPENETEGIVAWLGDLRGGKTEIITPKRGTKKDIVAMATENAAAFLRDEEERARKKAAATSGAVEELKTYLNLPVLPRRMECFDISHNQGQETVASMVVFEDGAPKKSAYRRYKIKSAEGKPDDFKSMREVTARRYGKLNDEEMPDLIVIDGGLGQLSSALEIIRGAGHAKVPVVGLAKQFELVFVEGTSEPVELPRRSEALYLIERIRDEAHRFAITYHRLLRGKRNLVSILDHVDGIGAKRRAALMKHFGNINKIKAATVEELAAVPGMTKAAAQAVINFFHGLAAGE